MSESRKQADEVADMLEHGRQGYRVREALDQENGDSGKHYIMVRGLEAQIAAVATSHERKAR